MKNLIQRLQAASPTHLWLLSALILAISPHVTHLPVTLIVFSACLFCWRLGFELKLFRLPGRLLRMFLTLVALVITFEAFHTLFGRQAGIGLLVVMLCLKLMEMKEERDVIVAIGLGYFIVVTVFLFNQSIFIGLYMLIVVVLLTTALTCHNREHSKIHQLENLKLASTLLLQAAPLMLLLFVLFPRVPGPLWSLPSDSLGGKTGLSNSMSPGNISRLSNNDAVAFRVQFEKDIPPRQKLYWRGPVFSYFDGKTWNASDAAAVKPAYDQDNEDSSYQAAGGPVTYTVTLEPSNQNWLFALEMVASLPIESDLSPDYEIMSRHPVEQLKRYTIQSYTDYRLNSHTLPNVGRYLQLPNNATTRIRNLLSDWQRESGSNPQKIVTLALRYFSEQPFYYTREPPLLFNNPVDEFLFDSRRGFCEHYASAFVYMMRASGIPARVVTGYQGGESNPLSDYFIVRQSDAHAWAEVWMENDGWIRIDPTSVIPSSRVENPQDLQRIAPDLAISPPGWAANIFRKLGYGWDNLNHFWNQWVLNYNNQRQKSFLSRFMSWFGFDGIDWRGMVVILSIGMLTVFSFIALQLFKREYHRKDPVVSAYQKFCRKLAHQGLVRNPAEGPADFARRAIKHYPKLGPAITHITNLYQRMRYTKHPPSGGLQQLQVAVRRFRPSMKRLA
ncbi:transglutaminase TgpA family protein [Kaarinaea lacus]